MTITQLIEKSEAKLSELPMQRPCGIYFLVNEKDEIVYVGQSNNIRQRVPNHRKAIVHNRVFYLETAKEELDAAEQKYIRLCQPRFNKTDKGDPSAKYTTIKDHTQLPKLTVTQEMVDEAESRHGEPFLDEEGNEIGRSYSVGKMLDSEWSTLFDEFYRQRIVYVRGNNTLLLRFAYDYEIDLDRIKREVNLLSWIEHLCGKNWMNTERLNHFIKVVADIKGFKIYGT
jgi:hypothetical protein